MLRTLPRAVSTSVVLVALAMVTASCSSSNSPESTADEPFVWLLPTDPDGMDPHFHSNVVGIQVRNQLFDPLISRDPEGVLEPALAEEWERIAPDVWEFKLRTDVEFTNGEPFDAETVAYNVERARDNDKSLWKTHFAPIEEVEIVSPDVVRMHTKGSYSILANQLSFLLMVPPVATEEAGEDFEQHPIGTGAYVLDEWVKDDHFNLSANDDYWGGAPEVSDVTIKIVPDANTRVAELLSGEADLSLDLPPAMREQLEASDSLVVEERGIARSAVMDMEADSGPLADERVRQAIALAIDVDGMLETLQGGLGQRIATAVTPAMFGYDDSLEPYPYDPEESRRLLDEAGWDPETVVDLNVGGSFIANSKSVLDKVTSDLKAVGITVNPYFDEGGSALIQKFSEGTANGIRLWTIGGLFDAGQILEVMYNSESVYGLADNPALDQVISDALTITEDDARVAAYADLQAQIQSEYRAVPLWEVRLLVGFNKDYEVTPRADQTVRLSEVSVKG